MTNCRSRHSHKAFQAVGGKQKNCIQRAPRVRCALTSANRQLAGLHKLWQSSQQPPVLLRVIHGTRWPQVPRHRLWHHLRLERREVVLVDDVCMNIHPFHCLLMSTLKKKSESFAWQQHASMQWQEAEDEMHTAEPRQEMLMCTVLPLESTIGGGILYNFSFAERAPAGRTSRARGCGWQGGRCSRRPCWRPARRMRRPSSAACRRAAPDTPAAPSRTCTAHVSTCSPNRKDATVNRFHHASEFPCFAIPSRVGQSSSAQAGAAAMLHGGGLQRSTRTLARDTGAGRSPLQ